MNTPEEIITEVLESLNPDALWCCVDAPIDTVCQQFEEQTYDPITTALFHNAISGLVFHLYRDALTPAMILTDNQALGIALQLLQHYNDYDEPGYESALLQALYNPPTGLETVFCWVANRVKQETHLKHKQWIYAKHLDPLTSQTREAIAKELLTRIAKPDAIAFAPLLRTAELANDLPYLFDRYMEMGAHHPVEEKGCPIESPTETDRSSLPLSPFERGDTAPCGQQEHERKRRNSRSFGSTSPV